MKELLPTSCSLLLAVSGGADSVALLDIMTKRGHRCVVAHCNFRLRGAESDRDEAFVRALCTDRSLPLRVTHFDTEAYARQRGVSIEMAARSLRYEWFESLLSGEGLDYVALAHHADDAVETFLLNLVRGTGIKGLTGIKPLAGHLYRPLLQMSRRDIEDYCKANRLDYITDSSNLTDDYKRNYLRHHVVPALKTLNPSLLRTMASNMRNLSDVADCFDESYRHFAETCVKDHEGTLTVSRQSLQHYSNPNALLHQLLSTYDFPAPASRDICRLMTEGKSGRVFKARSGVVARVDYGDLYITKETLAESEATINQDVATLTEPIRLTIRHETITHGYHPPRDKQIAVLDADRLTFPLILRHPRRADRFQPLGMKGTQKLSDYFAGNKIRRGERDQMWLLQNNKRDRDGQIVWIVGERIAHPFRVTDQTTHIVIITKH